MPEYLVRWEIDVEADNETDAAKQAWFTQHRGPESTANVFDVFRQDGTVARIDLSEVERKEIR